MKKIAIIISVLLLFRCTSMKCRDWITDDFILKELNGVVCYKGLDGGKKYPTLILCDNNNKEVFLYKQLHYDTLHSIFAKVDYGDSLYKAKGDSIVKIYWNGKLRGTYNVWQECPRVSR